jgi:hypothetical protein
MNIYENKYSLTKKKVYSFNSINVQAELKLWNDENSVKQTPF